MVETTRLRYHIAVKLIILKYNELHKLGVPNMQPETLTVILNTFGQLRLFESSFALYSFGWSFLCRLFSFLLLNFGSEHLTFI